MIKNADISNWIDIFNIRNNPIIRDISNNKEEINLDKHLEWYKEKIKNKKNIIKILETENWKIWYIRLDFIDEKKYLISIAILPNWQKKWYWKKLFEEAIKDIPKWSKIFAEILDKNLASINFFTKLGFKKENNKYIFIK